MGEARDPRLVWMCEQRGRGLVAGVRKSAPRLRGEREHRGGSGLQDHSEMMTWVWVLAGAPEQAAGVAAGRWCWPWKQDEAGGEETARTAAWSHRREPEEAAKPERVPNDLALGAAHGAEEKQVPCPPRTGTGGLGGPSQQARRKAVMRSKAQLRFSLCPLLIWGGWGEIRLFLMTLSHFFQSFFW